MPPVEDRQAGKLGKLPAKHSPKDLLLAEFRDDTKRYTQAPIGFGHYRLVPDFGMLGNDSYGDCVFAGSDHETMMWNAEAGVTVEFTAENALSDYSAVTGFDPNDPSTDQGTVVHDALDYRRHTGVVDAQGQRHQIGAYMAVEPGNFAHVLEAVYAFGVVGIGFEFPASAMDQFNRGKPWTYVRGSKIEGGHYVPVVGRPGAETLDVVTWGKVQPMTRRFFTNYCDEAFALLSPEMLTGGKSLEGFDLNALNAALSALGKP